MLGQETLRTAEHEKLRMTLSGMIYFCRKSGWTLISRTCVLPTSRRVARVALGKNTLAYEFSTPRLFRLTSGNKIFLLLLPRDHSFNWFRLVLSFFINQIQASDLAWGAIATVRGLVPEP